MLLNQNDVFAGRYVLQEMLGKGGFSVVWKATDNMADDTVVAIKIYAPDKGLDNQGIKQFSREYSLVQSLHHTRLLTARHFDVFEGSPYLVVPFCSKGSVGHMVSEKGNLSEKEIAEILQQVCEGLAYLHTREIIHQDIKPDNVLINDQGEYLLTDFGISSRVKTTLTKSTGSAFSMTVAYAAPERFAASPAIVPAGDMFAVGVMIYEMAVGDVPWMGQGGMAVQQNVTLPELPSAFSKPLTQWMQSLMMKDPAARPTAKVVADAAQQYLRTGQWPAAPMTAPTVEAPKPAYRGRETQKMEDIPFFQEQMSNTAAAPTPAPAASTPAAKPSSGKQTMAFGQGGTTVATKKTPVGLYAGIAVAVIAAGVGGWFVLGNKKEEPVQKETTTVVTTPKKETTVVTPTKDSTTTTTTETNTTTTETTPAVSGIPIPETVSISGGSFKMGNKNGAPDEQEEHSVNMKGFQISKTEITYDQYAAYCKAVGKPDPAKGSGNVVVNVTWNDAVAYCKWLSKESGSNWSLPSEAQWEYAAKKGGISGMTNGILEWCGDWYDEQYYTYASPDNPTGPSQGGSKVVRGSSNTDREFFAPSFKQKQLGFRVVKK